MIRDIVIALLIWRFLQRVVDAFGAALLSTLLRYSPRLRVWFRRREIADQALRRSMGMK